MRRFRYTSVEIRYNRHTRSWEYQIRADGWMRPKNHRITTASKGDVLEAVEAALQIKTRDMRHYVTSY